MVFLILDTVALVVKANGTQLKQLFGFSKSVNNNQSKISFSLKIHTHIYSNFTVIEKHFQKFSDLL